MIGVSPSAGVSVFACFILAPIINIFYQEYISKTSSGSLQNQGSLYYKNVTIIEFHRLHSSIWCEPCNYQAKCCEIHNLCYFPSVRQFAFVLDNKQSILHGVSNGHELEELLVSSVVNHTQLFLPLSIMSTNDNKLNEVKVKIIEPVFMMHRFKPDNIMHLLHDDLLPLFARYSTLCRGNVAMCTAQLRLVLIDPLATELGPISGNLSNWYKLLSDRSILNLPQHSPVVFSKVLIGLPDDTISYQYGFGQPHGPIPLRETSMALFSIFRKFFFDKFNINVNNEKIEAKSLLISRQQTRRILNEEEVQGYIKTAYTTVHPGIKLTRGKMDLQRTKNVAATMKELHDADMIVGMHGASMYLAAIFSKPNATIVELFPYGIQPSHVSPISSLSASSGCWFSYATWKNMDENATVPPSKTAPALIGGISHLSKTESLKVKNTLPVPPVECCHNSTYFYRMFQDTNVGSNLQYTIIDVLKSSQNSRKTSHMMDEIFLLPGKVFNLICKQDNDSGVTLVSWKTPINLSTFQAHKKKFYFSLVGMTESGNHVQEMLAKLKNIVKSTLKHVWVQACIDNVCGRDVFQTCY